MKYGSKVLRTFIITFWWTKKKIRYDMISTQDSTSYTRNWEGMKSFIGRKIPSDPVGSEEKPDSWN